jgi:hypothetical protein
MDRPWQPEHNAVRRTMRARATGARAGRATEIDPYWYSTARTAIAISGTVTVLIPVQEDAVFVAEYLTFSYDDQVPVHGDVSSDSVSIFTLLITDTGSARQMMDRATHQLNITGTGQRPHYLAVSKHFRPNSSIQIVVVNLDATTAHNFQLTIGGFKAYKYSNKEALGRWIENAAAAVGR